jgi:hypothetical protein
VKGLALAALLGLTVGCRPHHSDDELPPMTPLPQFHPPDEAGPASVPSEFRYPPRLQSGTGGIHKDAGPDAG